MKEQRSKPKKEKKMQQYIKKIEENYCQQNNGLTNDIKHAKTIYWNR